MRNWRTKLQSQGMIVQSAVLGLVVAIVYGAVAPAAGFWRGGAGLMAAAVAAALCFLGGALALVVCHLRREPKHVLQRVLLGMLPRMGIPLGFALFFQLRGGVLAEAGLLYYLVVFYPFTLAVETSLTLAPQERAGEPSNVSRNVAS